MTPKGYNIAPGGEEPSVLKGESNPRAAITKEVADRIKADLMNENLLRKDIKKKYGVSENIIRHINSGDAWRDETLSYPLRKPEEEIIADKVEQIKYYLKNSSLSQKQIAEKFGYKRSFVTMINIGKNHFDENEDYPIRKYGVYELDPTIVEEIIYDLKNTDTPINKIAEKKHVSKSVVSRINLGKSYYNKNLIYPIRK